MSAKQHRTVKDVNVITNKSNNNDLVLMSAGANSNSTIDTLYYVINFDNEQGFAFASADIRFEPVLCITENGNYYSGDNIDNPGFANFMEGLEIYLAGAPEPCDDCFSWISDYETEWETVSQVPEKLTVRWGQNAPYNNNCPPYQTINPNTGAITGSAVCPAGCVATAIAQIMSYYQYPTIHLFNWNIMLQHKSYPYYQNSTSAYSYLAYLLYDEIGVGVNMIYTPSESGSTAEYARSYLVGKGYICGNIINYNTDQIVAALNNNKLIFTRGQSSSTSISGHVWVIDGYLVRTRQVYPLVPPGQVAYYYDETQTLVHCNWGWDGNKNGYFVSGAFAAQIEPDTNNNSFSTNYSYDNKIILVNH
jgi:hypothetical protein